MKNVGMGALGFIGGAGKLVEGTLKGAAALAGGLLDLQKNGLKAAGALAYKLTGNYDNCPQYLKDGLDSTCNTIKSVGEHALAWGIGAGSDLLGISVS